MDRVGRLDGGGRRRRRARHAVTVIIVSGVVIFSLACVTFNVSERLCYGLALVMLGMAAVVFYFGEETGAVRLAGLGFDFLVGGALVELTRLRLTRFSAPARAWLEHSAGRFRVAAPDRHAQCVSTE